jgi:hypothetical protein
MVHFQSADLAMRSGINGGLIDGMLDPQKETVAQSEHSVDPDQLFQAIPITHSNRSRSVWRGVRGARRMRQGWPAFSDIPWSHKSRSGSLQQWRDVTDTMSVNQPSARKLPVVCAHVPVKFPCSDVKVRNAVP